jgi:hypothetical protein
LGAASGWLALPCRRLGSRINSIFIYTKCPAHAGRFRCAVCCDAKGAAYIARTKLSWITRPPQPLAGVLSFRRQVLGGAIAFTHQCLPQHRHTWSPSSNDFRNHR